MVKGLGRESIFCWGAARSDANHPPLMDLNPRCPALLSTTGWPFFSHAAAPSLLLSAYYSGSPLLSPTTRGHTPSIGDIQDRQRRFSLNKRCKILILNKPGQHLKQRVHLYLKPCHLCHFFSFRYDRRCGGGRFRELEYQF